MDSRAHITVTITIVATRLARADDKITALLKTTNEATQILQRLHDVLQGLRKSLRSLSQSLANPSFNRSILTSIETKKEKLFQYISSVLVSSVSIMNVVEGYVKSVSKSIKGSGKLGFLQKKKSTSNVAGSQIPAEPPDLVEQVHFIAISIEVGAKIIELQTSTDIAKPHLHDVRLHEHALADAITHLQASRDSLMGISTAYETTSTMIDYKDICLSAADFTMVVTKRADIDMTRKHSGFEPMSPLVEVLSNNSVLPNATLANAIDIHT